MTDQSLRAALEKVLATTDGWTVANETLLGVLAAHPAEPVPDPQPSDAAVEAAARALGADGFATQMDDARAALEAAYRVDAPRPALDLEAVRAAVRKPIFTELGTYGDVVDNCADAVLKLARPMPTREQIAAALARQFCEEDTETDVFDALPEDEQRNCVKAMGSFADAVLALLNRAGS